MAPEQKKHSQRPYTSRFNKGRKSCRCRSSSATSTLCCFFRMRANLNFWLSEVAAASLFGSTFRVSEAPASVTCAEQERFWERSLPFSEDSAFLQGAKTYLSFSNVALEVWIAAGSNLRKCVNKSLTLTTESGLRPECVESSWISLRKLVREIFSGSGQFSAYWVSDWKNNVKLCNSKIAYLWILQSEKEDKVSNEYLAKLACVKSR